MLCLSIRPISDVQVAYLDRCLSGLSQITEVELQVPFFCVSQVFIQAAADGQVYTAVQSLTDAFTFSAWTRVGLNKLPTQSTPAALTDSVTLGVYGDETLVFARSMSSNNSQLYWCKGNWFHLQFLQCEQISLIKTYSCHLVSLRHGD